MPFKPHPDNPDLVIYTPSEYWIFKPWQGLTDEEIRNSEFFDHFQYGDPRRDKIYQFAYAIEAKLREKNT